MTIIVLGSGDRNGRVDGVSHPIQGQRQCCPANSPAGSKYSDGRAIARQRTGYAALPHGFVDQLGGRLAALSKNKNGKPRSPVRVTRRHRSRKRPHRGRPNGGFLNIVADGCRTVGFGNCAPRSVSPASGTVKAGTRMRSRCSGRFTAGSRRRCARPTSRRPGSYLDDCKSLRIGEPVIRNQA